MKTQNLERIALRKLRLPPFGRRGILAIAASIGLLAAACATDDIIDTPGDGVTPTTTFSLDFFASCDSLDDYLVDVVTDTVAHSYAWNYYYGYGRGGVLTDDFGNQPVPASQEGSATVGDANSDASGGAVESPTDFTETNVQEEGVDEADLMKTDGDYIYVLQGNSLHIVDSWPADETRMVSTFQLDSHGTDIFLAGDRVAIFTSIYEYAYDDGYPQPGEPTPVPAVDGSEDIGDAPIVDGPDVEVPTYTENFIGTRVTVLDVSDRTDPQLVQEFDIEGSYVNSRMVGDYVYLITMAVPEWYAPELEQEIMALDLPTVDYETADEDRELIEAQTRNLIRPVIADYVATTGRDNFIPDLREDGARTNSLACTRIMRPSIKSDLGLLSVLAFNPNSDDAANVVGLLANGWQVYGSENALYVSQDSRWWWFETAEDRVTRTQIHSFNLNDGDPVYAASGIVDGWVLNQFSMSEYMGSLRIATTDQSNDWWWDMPMVDVAASDGGPATSGSGTTTNTTEPVDVQPDDEPVVVEPEPEPEPEPAPMPEPEVDANNIFVLQQNGRELEVVGEVRGIAPTEQIYAVRFVGDFGYVVTFRQTDPLFTIDLSDPTDPIVRGELEIPGFSSYLHPFGDDYLIGVGRNGDETGRISGLHLQLFDVSDPDNPVRLHQEIVATESDSWSYSVAEHDHRAFTFWGTENLLAIPVTLESYGYEDGNYSHFSGIIAYEVSAENGFVERGRVSHTSFAHTSYCGEAVPGGVDERDIACESWAYNWYAYVQRSTFIEGFLYAISDLGLTTSSVDDLDNILAAVPFK